MACHLAALHCDVLLPVCAYLSVYDVVRLGSTCRSLRDSVDNLRHHIVRDKLRDMGEVSPSLQALFDSNAEYLDTSAHYLRRQILLGLSYTLPTDSQTVNLNDHLLTSLPSVAVSVNEHVNVLYRHLLRLHVLDSLRPGDTNTFAVMLLHTFCKVITRDVANDTYLITFLEQLEPTAFYSLKWDYYVSCLYAYRSRGDVGVGKVEKRLELHKMSAVVSTIGVLTVLLPFRVLNLQSTVLVRDTDNDQSVLRHLVHTKMRAWRHDQISRTNYSRIKTYLLEKYTGMWRQLVHLETHVLRKRAVITNPMTQRCIRVDGLCFKTLVDERKFRKRWGNTGNFQAIRRKVMDRADRAIRALHDHYFG